MGLDNSVNITGRLTKDVELKATTKGTAVVSFTLAVKRGFSKNGDVDFINCVAWSHSANYLAKYASKGDLVSAEGELRSRTFGKQDGSMAFVTEVNCNQVSIRSKSGGGESVDDGEEQQPKPRARKQPQQPSDHGLEETEVYVTGDGVTEDDVPF